MTFDKQSNARRTAVESKWNRSCNERITSQRAHINFCALCTPLSWFACGYKICYNFTVDQTVNKSRLEQNSLPIA